MPKAKAKTGGKRQRLRPSRSVSQALPLPACSGSGTQGDGPWDINNQDRISQLSLELLERIFDYLPLRTIFSCEKLNRHFQFAVHSYLKVLKMINLTEHEWNGFVPQGFTSASLLKILRQCPQVEVIRGLHFPPVRPGLQFDSVIKELKQCRHLRQVDVSNLDLAVALVKQMPQLDLGHFANRGADFEIEVRPRFSLCPGYRISKLHLTGVSLEELPETPFVEEVVLEWVELTSSQPFQNFICPALRSFVMRNCFGPLNALKYVALIDNLARCANLERLEFVRIPFLPGLIQHKVAETAQEHTGGFGRLKTVVISGCKECTEQDLGYLLLAASKTLENLQVQPCLTRDSLFLALKAFDIKFFKLKTLHLGYVDPWSTSGKYTPIELQSRGLAEVNQTPALLTDMGMNAMGQVFPNVQTLTVYNCPHLRYPRVWLDVEPVDTCWSQLTSLHLRHCHGVQLHDSQSLSWFLEWLPSLEDVHFERMFPKPPKGCSRVGLSAGTGIGVSSALVAMNPGAQHPPEAQRQAEVQVPNIAPGNQNPQRPQMEQNRQVQNVGVPNVQVVQVQVQMPNQLQEPPGPQGDGQGMQDIQQEPQEGEVGDGSHDNESHSHSDEQKDQKCNESEMVEARPTSSHATTTEHSESDSSPSPSKKTTQEGKDGSQASSIKSDCAPSDAIKRPHSPEDSSASASSGAHKLPRSQEVVQRRNVKDASTSAMASRLSCPIHGSVMQDDSSEDDDDTSSTDDPSHIEQSHSAPASGGDSTVERVGAQPKEAPAPNQDQRPQMCDQATSTSDPVMESDPVLIFKCNSQTLKSATFNDCGISHIHLQGCQNLQSVQGHNLPIFKQLRLGGEGGSLSRVQFEQCPKINVAGIMSELLTCQPTNRLFRIRPMHSKGVSDLDGAIVTTGLTTLDSNYLVIKDSSTPPQAHHATAIQDWIHALSQLNQDLLSDGMVEDAERQTAQDEMLDCSRLNQKIIEDGKLAVLTDIPWLKPLIKKGLFHLGKPPAFGADYSSGVADLKEQLSGSISAASKSPGGIYPHIFCCYIQTSDTESTTIPSEFMPYPYQ